ncbi:hypothetical protein ACX80U_11990 [Arthrobacter sp. TmT3-37]
MTRILTAAPAGTAIGATAGWLAVAVILPPLIRHSGHYGSRVPARSR